VRASRFLYEANPGLSICLGELLGQGVRESTLTADDTTIAKQYLASIGVEIPFLEQAEEQQEPASTSRKSLEMHDIAEGLRVWHQTFGAGTVIEVKDRRQGRLMVDFDDHGEMILLAGYAGLQSY